MSNLKDITGQTFGRLKVVDCANRHQMKPVVQYDLHMNIVGEYQSIKEASEATGINYNGISKCCRGEICKSHGFIWHFKSNVKENGI